EIARTSRGFAVVLAAWIRRRGRPEWIEDAWYDLLRQIAWWTGMRAGLIRGRRIWRPGSPPATDPPTD
ncbi:MAG: hypothetical protein ACJ75Z_05295, partial [Solirubrobacterales bacterium]